MARIFPFQGLRYAPENADGDISLLTAPPYDVIDSEAQRAFYANHPANVVRLILNQPEKEDSAQYNPYTRATEFLKQWIEEGTLKTDPQPAVYAYHQQWTMPNGQPITRKGVIALLALEPYDTGVVLPHENIIPKYVNDRLTLIQHCQTNLSPIFMIYEDPERWLENNLLEDSSKGTHGKPTVFAEDEGAVTHQLWVVDNPQKIQALQQRLLKESLLIADGHHRYETALTYQRFVREAYQKTHGKPAAPGSLKSDYIMVFLANTCDPGLLVEPTHRLFRQWPETVAAQWSTETLLQALEQDYQLIHSPAPNASGDLSMTLHLPAQDPIGLRLKTAERMVDPHFWGHRIPEPMRWLDVALLDTGLIQHHWKTTASDLKNTELMRFYQSREELKYYLDSQKAVCGFEMNTPVLSAIKAVCQAGHRMPQKSTYFYPKIRSGLVFYSYI